MLFLNDCSLYQVDKKIQPVISSTNARKVIPYAKEWNRTIRLIIHPGILVGIKDLNIKTEKLALQCGSVGRVLA